MTKERKNGILGMAADLFRRNWGLKLLALALAILVYHTFKPTGNPATTIHDRQLFQNR